MIDPYVVALWAGSLLFGLTIGSFVTVVVYRVPRHESLVSPRSRCPGCGEMVRPRDNIPVVSWVLLRGRCRYCDRRISVRYPLTELANGALWVGAFALFTDELLVALIFACFSSVLLAVSLIDLERHIIPNAIVYPSLVVFGVAVALGAALGMGLDLLSGAIGLLAYGGGLLLIVLVYPKGMGMGDVKLAGLIGLVLGALGLEFVLIAWFLAILVGGIVGIGTMLISGGDGKTAIPFGPSLAVGAVASTALAPQIWGWYSGMLS